MFYYKATYFGQSILYVEPWLSTQSHLLIATDVSLRTVALRYTYYSKHCSLTPPPNLANKLQYLSLFLQDLKL